MVDTIRTDQGRNGTSQKQPEFSERAFVANIISTLREGFRRNQFDPRRDIDCEAGYPKIIGQDQFRTMYDREGIATRVVQLWPDESWAKDPAIMETGEAEETPFESDWRDLQKLKNIYHFLHRIDELSGIGHYGTLLLGINDGKQLREPVNGINDKGEKEGSATHELMFLRTFDESLAEIVRVEQDATNPRFGQPLMYRIKFDDPSSREEGRVTGTTFKNQDVHWSRIIHIADNRKVSEIFGVPRQKSVFNRLLDLRKILGGSPEMFWKGGFPGLAFEGNPDIDPDVSIDKKAIREEAKNYQDGMQRILTIVGGTVKTLSPNIASPIDHFEIQLKAIAISLAVPIRILLGSEAAKLASNQDQKTWNTRVRKRNETYVSPMVIRPTIDRFITFGILTEPVDGYEIIWPDILTATNMEKAEVANRLIEALAKYIQGDVQALIQPMDLLVKIMDMPIDEAEAILEATDELIRNTDHDEDEEDNE